MSRLLFLLVFFVFTTFAYAVTSPHGSNLKFDCKSCHTTDNWNTIRIKSFDHQKTKFPLEGQHKIVNCISCHPTLKFTDAPTECSACHKDVHQQTLGLDCNRCHTPESWLVKKSKIAQLHQESGMPLIGSHASADCQACHVSSSKLRYDILNHDCYSCHKKNYDATTNPNHQTAGFGTDCNRCHNMIGKEWNGVGQGFEHGFFPLKGGHLLDCTQCHTDGNYSGLDPACVSCHLDDYNATINPRHLQSGFSKECQQCHQPTTWKQAIFDHDSKYFPIYSGTHKGEWNACTECHSNSANYLDFSCLNCHEHNKTSMDSEHRGKSGYSYNSNSCLSCHPRGKAD